MNGVRAPLRVFAKCGADIRGLVAFHKEHNVRGDNKLALTHGVFNEKPVIIRLPRGIVLPRHSWVSATSRGLGG